MKYESTGPVLSEKCVLEVPSWLPIVSSLNLPHTDLVCSLENHPPSKQNHIALSIKPVSV